MSLLLDALQRASRDKDRSAASHATAAAPAPESPAQAHAAVDPRLQPTPLAPVSSPGAAQDFPQLSLEPVAEPSPAAVPSTPEPAALDVSALALVPPPEPQSAPTPTSLPSSPVMVSIGVAPETAPVFVPPVSAPTPSPVVRAPDVVPPPMPEPVLVAGGQTTAAPSDAAVATKERAARLAQQIQRAHDNPPPAGALRRVPSRTWALGAAALVLALAGGSVLLGLWGDPVELLGLGGGSSVAPAAPPEVPAEAPTPAAAASAPAPADTVVVSAAPPPGASAPQPRASAPVPRSGRPPLAGAPTARRKPLSDLAPAALPPSSEVAAVVSGDAVAPPALAAPGPAPAPATAVPSPGKTELVLKGRGPTAVDKAYAALSAGRLDEAQQHYETALQDQSEDRDALWGLAYLAQKRGDRTQAQDYYRRVLRQDPGNTQASNALWALESESVGEAPQQRAHDLVQRQPESASALAAAATAMAREGQWGLAAQWWARAQALEPHNPALAYNHAVTLDRLRQYPAALRQYEQALRLGASRPGDIPMELAQRRAAALRQALSAQQGTP